MSFNDDNLAVKMENSKARILIADDEREIRNILRIMLTKKGYDVTEAKDGAEAVEAVRNGGIDLVLMDIMMPQMNGIDATGAIREFSNVPVLFLTAKSLDSDKQKAYGEGGDDYVTKPFSSIELLLKVESLLRRYKVYGTKEQHNSVMLSGSIEVDVSARRVTKHGEEIVMRDKELDILMLLVERRGQTVETTEIYETVWQERFMQSSANNVMVNMLALRKKLEDEPSNPKLIKTVWGKGYRLE